MPNYSERPEVYRRRRLTALAVAAGFGSLMIAAVLMSEPEPDPLACGTASAVDIGVCETDVLRLMGYPTRESARHSASGENRVLYNEGASGYTSIHLRNGKVTVIRENR